MTVVGLVFIVIVVLGIVDVTQRNDVIRRNYSVVGRFQFVLGVGRVFHQYFLRWIEGNCHLISLNVNG
jgi:hypothetical protein